MPMTGYVVYMDVLLLLNFCMDFVLLWAAGRFLRRQTPLWRLLLAALLGCGYASAMVLPLPEWLWSPPAAVMFSLLMLAAAYPLRDRRSFLRLAGVFYLIACAAGGAALAAASLWGEGPWPGSVTRVRWVCLLMAAPVVMIVSRRGYLALRRAWSKESFRANLRVQAAGRQVALTALIDTGNDLTEPLSGLPVVVADYRALVSLLPERLRQAWNEAPEQPDQVLQRLYGASDTDGWVRRLRLVPFSSIGRRNGLLLGFRADLVVLEQEGRRFSGPAVVALSRGGLSGGDYQAVVNPVLLEQGKEGAA